MAPSSNFNFSASSLVFLLAVHACAQTCLPPPTIELSLGNCTFIYNDTEIDSYGILVGVGNSSNPQNICLMPSTVVNSTMLQSSEICDSDQLDGMTRAQCLSRRGGVVTRDALPPAPTDSLHDLNLGWVSLMSVDTTVPWQYAVDAAVQLRDQAVTMIEGLITQGQEHTMSHLGLAESSPLLQSLKNAGLIGARSWGLNAGSQSYSAPRVGSLVLGGYDEESIKGDFFNYGIPVPDPPLNGRPCPLKVTITELTLTVRNVSNSMVGLANSLEACIEPYDNLFRLPQTYLTQATNQINGILPSPWSTQGPVDASSYNSTLWNLEPGLVYPASAGPISASLRITLDNGLSVDIPSYELVRPLRGLDANGTLIVDTDFNEVQIFGQAAPEDGPVLGKAFLSQLYLYVDYETMNFSLALQNLDATTPLSKSSTPCPAQPTLTNTDKGLIAVGVVLGVVLAGQLAFVVVRFLKSPAGAADANREAPDHGEPDSGSDRFQPPNHDLGPPRR